MKTGIYKIINKVNNKFYIGSATNFYNRKSKHLQLLRKNLHANTHLQNSYNKYGENNFQFKLIEECNKEDLPIREQYYLDNLDWNYNICTKVEGRWGLTHTEEVKSKISNSVKKYHKEKGHSKETKRKISESLKGRKQSLETIEKRRQANIKAWKKKIK